MFIVVAARVAIAGDTPEPLSYYLPDKVSYDSATPEPSSVIGHEVGEWHVRHGSLVRYFRILAAASPRVHVERYGRSHEKRELVLAAISSPKNLDRLDEIRALHRDFALTGKAKEDLPIIIWLGYSVHGNESSGGNASLVVAYHLAAAMGAEHENLLQRAIILIDPCINPDGFSRFATWANQHRGSRLVADPSHREHVEPWPNGRTNHYWFDLNRDWLLLVHPESRARIERYQQWLPQVVGDFHEMGRHSTYFFQPGVPSRQNPLTPRRNFELTAKIGSYHARALDKLGSLYFTKQIFDDFYYGKGSTYPDAHGSVGILFEQASSRGHVQEAPQGLLTFPFTIRNQFATSLSTIAGAVENGQELREYQRSFFADARRSAAGDMTRAFVFGDPDDAARGRELADTLRRHDIEVYELGDTVSKGGREYRPGYSFIAPIEQRQYVLLKSVFERRKRFQDTTFYDVSAWTFPFAFGMPFAELETGDGVATLLGRRVNGRLGRSGKVIAGDDPYVYLFDWDSYWAPKAAFALLEKGVKLQVLTSSAELRVADGKRLYRGGTILIPLGIQELSKEEVHRAVVDAATESGIDIRTASSGLASKGVDLGSPDVGTLKTPSVALIVGSGVSTYEAGEAWFVLDQRFEVPVSLIDTRSASATDWSRYTHIVLVDGTYSKLESSWDELKDWVRAGGVLIAQRGGAEMARKHVLKAEKASDSEKSDSKDSGRSKSKPKAEKAESFRETRYADRDKKKNERRIGGAIFEAKLDTSHPLAFGYRRETLEMFRRGTVVFDAPKDPFSVVGYYSDEPHLAGYASTENVKRIAGTPSLIATRAGKGCVIQFADNPNFRGIWYGSTKLFLNGLFFAKFIESTGD